MTYQKLTSVDETISFHCFNFEKEWNIVFMSYIGTNTFVQICTCCVINAMQPQMFVNFIENAIHFVYPNVWWKLVHLPLHWDC